MNVTHSCTVTLIINKVKLRLRKIDHKLLDSAKPSLTQTLLFGNSAFATIINCSTKIINLTIDFVLSTKRFDGPLL